MNSKRVFFGMIAVLALLFIAIIGSAYLGNKMLQQQSSKLVGLKLKQQVMEQEKISLAKAKKDIEKYQSLNQIAKAIVPQDKDQARAVREIIKIAQESGFTPSSITFPASTLGAKTPLAAPAAPAAPAAGAEGGSGAAAPAPVAPKTPPSQLKAIKDIKGVYVLQITINQDPANSISYPQFLDFLGRLEQNRRTAQVSNIVLRPNPQDRNQVAFTLTVDEFIKP